MEWLKEGIDYAIFGILGFMSLLSFAYALERWWFYRKVNLEMYAHPELLENALTHNLTALSIISSNAPYIGLLGTVVGIMITFYDMAQNNAIESKTVLLGLSLALKATALGLLVAIPTLIIYTACLRQCDLWMARWRAHHAS